jgi:glycosyltransferase involved in cell wall biosynthesis
LLKLVEEVKPDLVHVQHEHGLYGFNLNPILPSKTSTGLDDFYDVCSVPVVTTFHTSMRFKQWMQLVNTKEADDHGYMDKLKLYLFYKYWKQLINYSSLHRINKYIMSKSAYGIVLSSYLRDLIPGTNVIYHGSEPYFTTKGITQIEARKKLHLPPQGRLALAQGFFTATKGWDIIKQIKMPMNWKLVVNYSKNFYNNENLADLGLFKKDNEDNQIINLNRNYLTEEELSLLFFSCDAVFLPYKISSGSGSMFDGLGHGKPFVASDLDFFKEFASKNLGIVSKRGPKAFEKEFLNLDKNYKSFEHNIKEFRKKISWDTISKQHIVVYDNIINKTKAPLEIIQRNQIYH